MNQQHLRHDHAKKKQKAGGKGRAVRWINGEEGYSSGHNRVRFQAVHHSMTGLEQLLLLYSSL